MCSVWSFFFFFQAEDGIRDLTVTGVQTCALPIYDGEGEAGRGFAEPGAGSGAHGGAVRALGRSERSERAPDGPPGSQGAASRMTWEIDRSAIGEWGPETTMRVEHGKNSEIARAIQD